MADLDLSVLISAPDGWHELEDELGGYVLHADSLATRSTPRRNLDVPGDWIDGTFTVRSTKDNVIEALVVYVEGGTAFEFATRLEALKGWFDQMNYQVKVRIGNALETWTCPKPGEYTEDLNQAYRFATRGLLRVQVSRLPRAVLESV